MTVQEGLESGDAGRTDDLERLLDEARESSPAVRLPTYRDAIARCGIEAIEPLTSWIEEPVLAAFAIRTLERIATLTPAAKVDVIDALLSVDRTLVNEPLVRDLDASLQHLGVDPSRSARRRAGGRKNDRPVGMPGAGGRGYWAMRTSPWERPYIWAEAQRGRLRQGWGWILLLKNIRTRARARLSRRGMSHGLVRARPSSTLNISLSARFDV